MAVLIPPGYAQVLVGIKHVSAVRSMAVTYGVDISAAGGNLSDVADTQQAALAAVGGLLAETDSSYTYTNIIIRSGSDPGPGPVFEKSVNLPGGTAGETPPVNTALLVRKVTPFGGRRNRGRFYWPGLVQDASVDELGVVTPARVTSLQSDFNTFRNNLETGLSATEVPTPMVILHDVTEGAVLPTDVTGLIVQPVMATQRRRMRP